MKKLLIQSLLLLAIGGISLSVGAIPENGAVLDEAKTLFETEKAEKAFDALEAYLLKKPDDIEVGNYYREIIRKKNQQDRAIRFFKEIVGQEEFKDDGKDAAGGDVGVAANSSAAAGQAAAEAAPPVEAQTSAPVSDAEKQGSKADSKPVANGTRYNLAFAFIDKIPLVGPMGAGFLSKASIKQFERVLEKEPDNWIANYGVGMNYLHWPNYFEKDDTSISYFQKCIDLQQGEKLRPLHVLPYIRLGDTYVKLDKIQEAIDIWKKGLEKFPDHPDLIARLALDEAKIKETILDVYNPDNSIGEIDTNIEILWVDNMPEKLVPLISTARKNKGIEKHFKLTTEGSDAADLFAWLTRNMPYLLNKDSLKNVNMSELGAVDKNNISLANLIAYNMIHGFMTYLQETSQPKVKTLLDGTDPFERPFLHEGIGMALGAAIDVSTEQDFSLLKNYSDKVGSEYNRLHYAGAGMWYGMTPTINMERILAATNKLSPFESAYFSEGLGFSVGLFHASKNPEILQVGKELPPLLASAFYNGVGRSFWILGGENKEFLEAALDTVPEGNRKDSFSGFGFGAGFTRMDNPSLVFGLANRELPNTDKLDYLTGVTMGYGIRFVNNEEFVGLVLRNLKDQEREVMAELLDISLDALAEVDTGMGDFHQNWRNVIHSSLEENPELLARITDSWSVAQK